MADNEFQIEAIGQVYAQALINLAQQQHVLDAVTDDVHSIAELVAANAQLSAFLHAVIISPEEKIAALDKIFASRVNRLTLETLKAMARRDRLMFIRGFLEAFDDILSRLTGRIDVELVSAAELSPQTLAHIKSAVQNTLGKEPHFVTRIDPRLIGGVRLRIGDTLIDGSVDTQLEKMKDALQRTTINRLQKTLGTVLTT